MRRHWVLKQDAVHVWIVIELVNLAQQIVGFYRGGQLNRHGFHAHPSTGVALHFDIGG